MFGWPERESERGMGVWEGVGGQNPNSSGVISRAGKWLARVTFRNRIGDYGRSVSVGRRKKPGGSDEVEREGRGG